MKKTKGGGASMVSKSNKCTEIKYNSPQPITELSLNVQAHSGLIYCQIDCVSRSPVYADRNYNQA